RVGIDADEIPFEELRQEDAVGDEGILGRDAGCLLDVDTSKEVCGVNGVLLRSQRSAEKDEVPADQRIDERLMCRSVRLLLGDVLAGSQEHEDVHQKPIAMPSLRRSAAASRPSSVTRMACAWPNVSGTGIGCAFGRSGR